MSVPGLRRYLRPPPRPVPGERCEMCAEPVGEEHSHVIDLHARTIQCTCRGCYLLFTRPGAGRHRSVPDRYLHVPRFTPGEALWESVGIPVRMAFFFTNSTASNSTASNSSGAATTAFYPSPAGATESLLPLGSWEEMLTAHPELATVADDVEALLVNRIEVGFECFLVPIDACYELVGLVKSHWRGFDGGTEAWEAIDGFFDRLRERSRVIADG